MLSVVRLDLVARGRDWTSSTDGRLDAQMVGLIFRATARRSGKCRRIEGGLMAEGFGKDVNDYLNAFVALADAKAAGFLAAGLTVGAAVLEIATTTAVASFFRWVSIATLAASVGANASVIFPRLPSGRRGLVFWEDIRSRRDLDDYIREATGLTEPQVEAEYAAQNYFVSDIVHRKHVWVRRGIGLFLVGVGSAVVAYLTE